jgi:hypothetical protein
MNTNCEYQNDGERITQPGKFEGEPVFAPYFWESALNGFADSDDGETFTFKLHFSGNKCGTAENDELTKFPTLRKWLGRKRTLRLREDSQGFVHCF